MARRRTQDQDDRKGVAVLLLGAALVASWRGHLDLVEPGGAPPPPRPEN